MLKEVFNKKISYTTYSGKSGVFDLDRVVYDDSHGQTLEIHAKSAVEVALNHRFKEPGPEVRVKQIKIQ